MTLRNNWTWQTSITWVSQIRNHQSKEVLNQKQTQAQYVHNVNFLQQGDAPHFATENASNKRTENETRRIQRVKESFHDQLNAKLSELYKELPRRNPKYSFERPYRNHLLRQINQIKYEQTLRRKGLRTQGVFITINK